MFIGTLVISCLLVTVSVISLAYCSVYLYDKDSTLNLVLAHVVIGSVILVIHSIFLIFDETIDDNWFWFLTLIEFQVITAWFIQPRDSTRRVKQSQSKNKYIKWRTRRIVVFCLYIVVSLFFGYFVALLSYLLKSLNLLDSKIIEVVFFGNFLLSLYSLVDNAFHFGNYLFITIGLFLIVLVSGVSVAINIVYDRVFNINDETDDIISLLNEMLIFWYHCIILVCYIIIMLRKIFNPYEGIARTLCPNRSQKLRRITNEYCCNICGNDSKDSKDSRDNSKAESSKNKKKARNSFIENDFDAIGFSRKDLRSKWKTKTITLIGFHKVGKTVLVKKLIDSEIRRKSGRPRKKHRNKEDGNHNHEESRQAKPNIHRRLSLSRKKSLSLFGSKHDKMQPHGYKNKKRKKKRKRGYAYDDCHLCERYYYYLKNGEKSCKFTIWDTVGDIRFSNNIIDCIEHSDMVIAIHDFTQESIDFIHEIDNEISERMKIERERRNEKNKDNNNNKKNNKSNNDSNNNKRVGKRKLIVMAIDKQGYGKEVNDLITRPSSRANSRPASAQVNSRTVSPTVSRAGSPGPIMWGDDAHGDNHGDNHDKSNYYSAKTNIYISCLGIGRYLENFGVINNQFEESSYYFSHLGPNGKIEKEKLPNVKKKVKLGDNNGLEKLKGSEKATMIGTSDKNDANDEMHENTEFSIFVDGVIDDVIDDATEENKHSEMNSDSENNSNGSNETDDENETKSRKDDMVKDLNVPPLTTSLAQHNSTQDDNIVERKETQDIPLVKVEQLFKWVGDPCPDTSSGINNGNENENKSKNKNESENGDGNGGDGKTNEKMNNCCCCLRHCMDLFEGNENDSHRKETVWSHDEHGDMAVSLSRTSTMRTRKKVKKEKKDKDEPFAYNMKKQITLNKLHLNDGYNSTRTRSTTGSVHSIDTPIRTKEIINVESDTDEQELKVAVVPRKGGRVRSNSNHGPTSMALGIQGMNHFPFGAVIQNQTVELYSSPTSDSGNPNNTMTNQQIANNKAVNYNVVQLFWGVHRRQSVRPCSCDQFTHTVKQFLVCLLFGLSAPIILVMQTIIIWSYSDTNQMLSNKFITDTLNWINIRITDFAIFKYDVLFSFFRSYYPDPSHRALIYSMAQNEQDTRLNEKTLINYGLLLRQPMKQKIDRLFVTLLTVVLTTMSMYNLICYFYFYGSDNNEFLSKFELLSAPIWLSVISSMLASFYSYNVNVHPSMSSNQATKEAETMVLSYIAYEDPQNKKTKQKITITVKMFLNNYQSYHIKMRDDSKFFKRKSSLVSIILAIGIATVPGIVRQINNSSNFFEDASVYEQLAAYIGWCLNCFFAIMAQYVFDMIFFTKVKDYARLTETITSLIEIPETVDDEEDGGFGGLNTCLACCGVGGDLASSGDMDVDTGDSSTDYGCCNCSSCTSCNCMSKTTDDEDEFPDYENSADSYDSWDELKDGNKAEEEDEIEMILNDRYGLGLLSLDNPTNLLSWMELRDNVCIKGIKIFGDLELFVLCISVWMIGLSAWLCIELLTRSSSSEIIGETFVSVAFLYVMSVLWIFNVFFLGSKFDRLQIRQISAIYNQIQCIAFETMHYQELKCDGPKSWKQYKCGEWNKLIKMQKKANIHLKQWMFNELSLKRNELESHLMTMKFCIEKLENYPINPQIFGIGLTATLTKSLIGSVVLPIISYIVSQYL